MGVRRVVVGEGREGRGGGGRRGGERGFGGRCENLGARLCSGGIMWAPATEKICADESPCAPANACRNDNPTIVNPPMKCDDTRVALVLVRVLV